MVPVTGRLRQENCLNPGGGGYSEPIVPLHSSLGDRVRLRLQKKPPQNILLLYDLVHCLVFA